MKVTIINPLFLLVVCVYASLFMFAGCGSAKSTIKKPDSPHYIGVPYIQFQPDTPKTHILSPKEQARLLAPYIKDNYNTFFMPEFNKLYGIINRQQGSIDQLTGVLVSMRERSIRRADSISTVIGKKESQIEYERQSRIKLEKVYLDEQRKQVARNAGQIDNLNNLANVLLVATIIIILCIIGLFFIAYAAWKKIRTLDRKVSHA